jgi:hypothetical protein
VRVVICTISFTNKLVLLTLHFYIVVDSLILLTKELVTRLELVRIGLLGLRCRALPNICCNRFQLAKLPFQLGLNPVFRKKILPCNSFNRLR